MCNLLHLFYFCQKLNEHNLQLKCDFGEMNLVLLPPADVTVNQHHPIVADAYNVVHELNVHFLTNDDIEGALHAITVSADA